MGKKIFLAATIAVFVCSAILVSSVAAEESDRDGQVVKMDGLDTLYYVAEGKRYVFPNEKTYKSWFTGFEDVAVLAPSEIYALPLAGNIRYRPGVLLVKITTDPKVYAVTKNGVLRWVKTEALAKKLYGEKWNLLIDDIQDSFFTNYTIGDPIENTTQFDPDEEAASTDTINKNRGLALGRAKRAMTAKCRAIPAEPNRHGPGATPAVPARECKMTGAGEAESEEDKLAPDIFEITVLATATTADIAWKTDETASSGIKFALESLSAASTSAITTLNSSAATTVHSLALTGLTASTTYYYMIFATDASANRGESTEMTFITAPAEEEPATQ